MIFKLSTYQQKYISKNVVLKLIEKLIHGRLDPIPLTRCYLRKLIVSGSSATEGAPSYRTIIYFSASGVAFVYDISNRLSGRRSMVMIHSSNEYVSRLIYFLSSVIHRIDHTSVFNLDYIYIIDTRQIVYSDICTLPDLGLYLNIFRKFVIKFAHSH